MHHILSKMSYIPKSIPGRAGSRQRLCVPDPQRLLARRACASHKLGAVKVSSDLRQDAAEVGAPHLPSAAAVSESCSSPGIRGLQPLPTPLRRQGPARAARETADRRPALPSPEPRGSALVLGAVSTADTPSVPPVSASPGICTRQAPAPPSGHRTGHQRLKGGHRMP